MASMQVGLASTSVFLSDLAYLSQLFEATLKEVVQAKRLSASRMTKLTEIAMKSLSVSWSK